MAIRRLLVANRSEIAIRVFRSAHELGISNVAIYTHEDRFALHRFKAEEAYRIGTPGEPIRAYLDIPSIIQLAKKHNVDAIHPGYGFLSENAAFASACAESGILFVGPKPEVLRQLGDKTSARGIAIRAGVSVLGGTERPIATVEEGQQCATEIGFPIIIKAAHGGGGRGMRVVHDSREFAAAFQQAQREAAAAFGSGDVFVEKYVRRARHIEVQLLGDQHGNLVHLYERDCTVQRRHQKVVEIAPSPQLPPERREELCQAALKIGRAVNYENAGTVEFLLDMDTGEFFFIEVNPRIQVEHTVTEQVTGIDIVKSQILIAAGLPLHHPDIGIADQSEVRTHGFAVQCRVTTEDPENQFLPDYGRISHYRSASGMGIRLDAGSAYSGAVVNPFYDSLLVKVTAWGRRFQDAVNRMERCLNEFRVRGVKTNLPFLARLIAHPDFLQSTCTTRFIDETPSLFEFRTQQDRATRLLSFLADVIVNGNPLVKGLSQTTRTKPAPVPEWSEGKLPAGYRDKLHEMGATQFCQWIRQQKPLLITDTTFRDAHQSLFATRLRTHDMLNIAEAYAYGAAGLFSLEMWGGATFDTAMRFLKESPWLRLEQMRSRVPNVLFQMLLRASSAVGYTNYPDNVVDGFVQEAASAGIDVFRVFDALNWLPNLRASMESILKTPAICEAAICYTGDILDPRRSKYDLKYYVNLAKELERMGAHMLAIKDMAGLCKPHAARQLVRALKQEIGIPIHFHTHDTAGTQAASMLFAAEEGLDVADAAMAPLSGTTSQPNLNTLVESLRFSDRETGLDTKKLDLLADYWRAVREFYIPFDQQVLPATADLYEHEMPGGQYTNLYQQALALGLADRWHEICQVYAQVNHMFGDIVKVTPTSKAVGDMALFMVANEVRPEDILRGNRELSYPASVLDLLGGRMGQPPGGFPPELVRRILRDQQPLSGRPGEILPPADFGLAAQTLEKRLGHSPTKQELSSHLLYPKVFAEFLDHEEKYGDVSGIPTPIFFYGLSPGEEFAVDIEKGKTLIIKYLTEGSPHPDGCRTVFFEVNGVPRDVSVLDHGLQVTEECAEKADPENPKHIGSAMPGMVVTVGVTVGETVHKGQKLLSIEAMKMETTIHSERDGKIAQLRVKPGSQVETGDLLIVFE